MHDRKASAAKLVATIDFTSDSVAFAEGKPIELIDATALLKLLQNVQTSDKIVLPDTEEGDHLTPDCPRCGAEMVTRTARRGENPGEKFWGCRNYPACRGTPSDLSLRFRRPDETVYVPHLYYVATRE